MLSHRSLLTLLLLFSLLLAGCGDSQDYVVTSSSPQGSATVALRSVLAQTTVPARVDSFRATGFGLARAVLYGPVIVSKAAEVRWQGVPVETTEFLVEYLDADQQIVGFSRVQVQLAPGQTYLIDSPPITLVTGTLRSLTVSPSTRSVPRGTSAQFTAMGAFSDGTTRDLTSTVTWTSDAPTVASISQGRAEGLSVGTSTVTASFGNISATATLVVKDASLLSLRLSPIRSTIARGTSQSFTAEGVFSDGSFQELTSEVSWSSSNTTVSAVAGGVASGLEPGTATVTATLGNVTSSANLTVTAAALESLTVSGPDSIAKGTSTDFTATGLFTDDSTQDLTTQVRWTVSPADAATFDGGRLTGVLNGTVTVTATLDEISDQAQLEITPAAITSIQVRPAIEDADPLAYVNQTLSLKAVATYTDSSTQDVTNDAVWTTGNDKIATVDAGLVTGIGLGQTNVTATLGVAGSLEVEVESVWPELVLQFQPSYSFSTTSGTLLSSAGGSSVPAGWNPDTHTLKVRSFTVASGTLLNVTGDHPFSVYADGDIDIAGAINASGADGQSGVDGRQATDGADGEDGGWVALYYAGKLTRTGSIKADGGRGGNGGNFVLSADNEQDASAGNGGDGGERGQAAFISLPSGNFSAYTGFSGRGGAGGHIDIEGSNGLVGYNVTVTAGVGGQGGEAAMGGNGGSIWLAWENRGVALAGAGGAGGRGADGGKGGSVSVGSYNQATAALSTALAQAGDGGRGGDGDQYSRGGVGGDGGDVSANSGNVVNSAARGSAIVVAGSGGRGGARGRGGNGGFARVNSNAARSRASVAQVSAGAGGDGGVEGAGGNGGVALILGSNESSGPSSRAILTAGAGGNGDGGGAGGSGGDLTIGIDNFSLNGGQASGQAGHGGNGASGGNGGSALVAGSQTQEDIATATLRGGNGGNGRSGPGGLGGVAEVVSFIIQGIVENGGNGLP